MPPGEGIECTACTRAGREGKMQVNFIGNSVNMKCSNNNCDSEY